DLLEEGARLAIVDPKVPAAQIARDLGQAPSAQGSDGRGGAQGGWQLACSALEAATGADAVLLLTEWAEFGDLDWEAIGSVMRKPAWLFDARATADASAARSAGLKVWRVGEG
ncbi:MAG: nucleotide sugar dehydrogenase, partial [Cyanobium sp. LacPavin_0920_WC12_MAG_62_9]|nr:nucleotide sugar dehydrogenase [Cyanobium sp. LacPavin_0920_WC12_MAG_62_9]